MTCDVTIQLVDFPLLNCVATGIDTVDCLALPDGIQDFQTALSRS